MALTWDLKDCAAWNATYLRDENGEIVVDEEGKRQFIDEAASDRMWLNIQQIGFALINLGFPKGPWQITEENWHEVYCRIYMNEKVNGAFRCNVDGPVYFEPGDVHELIGATLNVGNRTDFQANVFITRVLRNNAEQKIYSWEKEQKNGQDQEDSVLAAG